MVQDADLGRGGGHALGQKALAQHGVDERRLAAVELADDDQQEELVELLERALERSLILWGDLKAGQGQLKALQRLFFVLQELRLFAVQDGS